MFPLLNHLGEGHRLVSPLLSSSAGKQETIKLKTLWGNGGKVARLICCWMHLLVPNADGQFPHYECGMPTVSAGFLSGVCVCVCVCVCVWGKLGHILLLITNPLMNVCNLWHCSVAFCQQAGQVLSLSVSITPHQCLSLSQSLHLSLSHSLSLSLSLPALSADTTLSANCGN